MPAGVESRCIGEALPCAVNFAACDTVIHLAGRAHTTVAVVGDRDLDAEVRPLVQAAREAMVNAAMVTGIARPKPLHAFSG